MVRRLDPDLSVDLPDRQGGRHVAANIRRMLKKKEPLPFRYADKGSLATIGRRAAVADFGAGWMGQALPT